MATGLIATLRNAVQWAGFDLGRSDSALANAAVLVNPDNGNAYAAGLGIPAAARQIAFTSSNTNTQLTASCRRASLFARTADARYSIGALAQTASSTSHYIAQGERIDVALPAGAHLAVVSAFGVAGVLEVTELA